MKLSGLKWHTLYCHHCVLCSFVEAMVTLFPHSDGFPSNFQFEGEVVRAKSSDDHVPSVHMSHSSVNNKTFASFNLTFHSQGLNFSIQASSLNNSLHEIGNFRPLNRLSSCQPSVAESFSCLPPLRSVMHCQTMLSQR